MTDSIRRPRRWWRILKWTLIVVIVIAVILVYGVFPFLIAGFVARAGTRPMDRKLTETPATYGAPYRDVEFQTSDGVTIRGWLLASGDKHVTIVYSHGLFRSRRELLERATDLWKRGYGALLYDSRNHGDSGHAKVTLGYDERLDAEAAVRFLHEQERSEDRIVLYGISMGAAAVLLAAAESPGDVSAVIADSSFLSFDDTTAHHVNLLHLPAFPLANELRFFIEKRASFDGNNLNEVDAVQRLGQMPAMFIAAARDRRMPPEIAQRLYHESKSPKKALLIVDGPGADIHGHAYQADPTRYIEEVSKFLESALGQHGQE
jgi:pimeloyl-ACP methyl ester carboxylesterase